MLGQEFLGQEFRETCRAGAGELDQIRTGMVLPSKKAVVLSGRCSLRASSQQSQGSCDWEQQEQLCPEHSWARAALASDGLFSTRLSAGINLRMSLGLWWWLGKGCGKANDGSRVCVCA